MGDVLDVLLLIWYIHANGTCSYCKHTPNVKLTSQKKQSDPCDLDIKVFAAYGLLMVWLSVDLAISLGHFPAKQFCHGIFHEAISAKFRHTKDSGTNSTVFVTFSSNQLR